MTVTDHSMKVIERILYVSSRGWLVIYTLLLGIFVGLPFLAPLFMHWGWELPAKLIYFIYSFMCHQLPQRSFFLFGSKAMYSLGEIQSAWQDTLDPLILREFIGNSDLGWKVAWSDRMVSMYVSMLVFGLVWWLLRKRLKSLPWWGLLLFLTPMGIDGITHFISDLAGIGQGFRDTNTWLASIMGDALPSSFYGGDAFGSFNSWMRLLSGVLFGIGVVWFGFPYIDVLLKDIST